MATRPPPIPLPTRGGVAPMAPSPATTAVMPAAVDDLVEDTRNLEAPDATQLVARLLDLVGSEAEALLDGDDADGRRADLNIRTALASWDVLHEPDETARLLELAEHQPLAPRSRLAIALASGDAAALTGAQAWDRSAARVGACALALAVEVAEAWLVAARARGSRGADLRSRVARRHHRRAAGRMSSSSPAPRARGDQQRGGRAHPELQAAPRPSPDEARPTRSRWTAALLLDRGADPAAALAECWDALAHFDASLSPLGWLRVLEVALDAACSLDDERRLELLERRAELIAGLAGGALEALATRHAVAAEIARHGAAAEATAQWTELADDPAAKLPNAAQRIARLASTWSAAAAAARPAALAAHRVLAELWTGMAKWRRRTRRGALEIAAASGEIADGRHQRRPRAHDRGRRRTDRGPLARARRAQRREHDVRRAPRAARRLVVARRRRDRRAPRRPAARRRDLASRRRRAGWHAARHRARSPRPPRAHDAR